jgi:hypothetical protein
VEDDAMILFDACPTRQVFMEFSSGPGLEAAVGAAGLPAASVQPLGTVHAARIAEQVAPGGWR